MFLVMSRFLRGRLAQLILVATAVLKKGIQGVAPHPVSDQNRRLERFVTKLQLLPGADGFQKLTKWVQLTIQSATRVHDYRRYPSYGAQCKRVTLRCA